MAILKRQIHSNNGIAVKWEQDCNYRSTNLHDYPMDVVRNAQQNGNYCLINARECESGMTGL